ncbi:hypothetical protein ACFCWT_18795 [Streptomyces olivaceus]|uniref:hypothetical protein n=1 Tax=Streptomyces olivaceus TaxID=47716 RepID=UPI0035E27984
MTPFLMVDRWPHETGGSPEGLSVRRLGVLMRNRKIFEDCLVGTPLKGGSDEPE